MENKTNPQENTPFITVSIKKPIIEWADIPEGSILMPSIGQDFFKHEADQKHEVYIPAFKMSKYAITFEQYDLFCEAAGKDKPDDEGWGRGKRPVIHVSWNDAKAFADWMACRLPSEAEWEYACRAGSTGIFNTGVRLTVDQAVYRGNVKQGDEHNEALLKTLTVGSFAPNAWGLYDMHGNVWEWCMDTWDDQSYKENTDGHILKCIIPSNAKVLRGGSYLSDESECSSDNRRASNPDAVIYPEFGFRLVSPI
ncbi:MAG: formylglycine-generating enzyme family protein [Bacteroidales bacterium]